METGNFSTTSGFSDECLKSILRFMDANQRFHLSQQCPSLRSFEKSVPLYVYELTLLQDKLFVNAVEYQLGDGQLTVLDKRTGQQIREPSRHSMEDLISRLLSGYQEPLSIGLLLIPNSEVLKFPESLKVKALCLTIQSNVASVMGSLSKMLDEKSFPLRRLYVIGHKDFEKFENFSHDACKNAKKLVILGRSVPVSFLCSLPNKRIHLESADDYTVDDFMRLIEKWADGTTENIKTAGNFHYKFTLSNPELVKQVFALSEVLGDAGKKDPIKFFGKVCEEFPNVIVYTVSDTMEIYAYCEKKSPEKWLLTITIDRVGLNKLYYMIETLLDEFMDKVEGVGKSKHLCRY